MFFHSIEIIYAMIRKFGKEEKGKDLLGEIL